MTSSFYSEMNCPSSHLPPTFLSPSFLPERTVRARARIAAAYITSGRRYRATCPNHPEPANPHKSSPPPRAAQLITASPRLPSRRNSFRTLLQRANEEVNGDPWEDSNNGSEAAPRRVRARRRPARRQADSPPALLLDVRRAASCSSVLLKANWQFVCSA